MRAWTCRCAWRRWPTRSHTSACAPPFRCVVDQVGGWLIGWVMHASACAQPLRCLVRWVAGGWVAGGWVLAGAPRAPEGS